MPRRVTGRGGAPRPPAPGRGGPVDAAGGATCAEADPRARPRRVGRGEHRRIIDASEGICSRGWSGQGSRGWPPPPHRSRRRSRRVSTPGAPLTRTLCQACHQADGRGAERLAPSLIGSEFALAPSVTIPIRIVLNGKEGTVALMLPLGATLTDEQVAAALTYIRREWLHTASAVDPAAVAQTRKATVHCTRPWI